jgi:lipoprotein-anchoring transpeptidase ErfK/SrfK
MALRPPGRPRGRRAWIPATLVAIAILPATNTSAAPDRVRDAPVGSVGGWPSISLVRAAERDGPSLAAPDEEPVETPEPVEEPVPEPPGELIVGIERAVPITVRPGGGRTVGTMPPASRFYGEPLVAWIQRVSPDGRYGLVSVPYVAGDRQGWMRLRGLEDDETTISVEADLSEHRIVVRRGDRVLLRAPAATGAPGSPTPTGHFFVTDRVAFPGGGALGTYAFGISGIQPNLPAGWAGGDQLAIHGTNVPTSIGRSVSAGCLRVSERVLDRLRPLLDLGTPVVIHP